MREMFIAYPDPATVPSNFTGCLTRWIGTYSDNAKIFEVRFTNGKLMWVRGGDADIYCEYDGQRVTRVEISPKLKQVLEAYNPKGADAQLCPEPLGLAISEWK